MCCGSDGTVVTARPLPAAGPRLEQARVRVTARVSQGTTLQYGKVKDVVILKYDEVNLHFKFWLQLTGNICLHLSWQK